MDGPPPIPTTPWTIRPLRVPEEIAAFADLNRQCDPGEAGASTHYAQFKERIRKTIASWMKRGALVWWGVFEQDTLIGQCGFGVFGSLGSLPGRGDTPGRTKARRVFRAHRHRRQRRVSSGLHESASGSGQDGTCDPSVSSSGVSRGWQQSKPRSRKRFRLRARRSQGRRARGSAAWFARRFLPTEKSTSSKRCAMHATLISLVAVRSGAVLGHVLFTPVRVVDAGEVTKAVALGPLAVRPDRQRQGVGSRLVREGLRACRQAGHRHCFVLGDPDYYGRFGFEPASTCGATCEWDVPPTAFQALVLAQDAPAPRGRVRYAPALSRRVIRSLPCPGLTKSGYA